MEWDLLDEEDIDKKIRGTRSVPYFGKDCKHLCGSWEDYNGNFTKKRRPWKPTVSYCNHPLIKKEKSCKEETCPKIDK